MARKTKKKEPKTLESIRKSQEKSVNLMSNSSTPVATFLGFKLKNVDQLWKWDTLEDVKF